MIKTIFIGCTAWLFSAAIANAQTWWPQTSTTTVNLMNINFYDDYLGYSFGDTLSTMVSTSNSGTVWSELSPAFTAANLQSSAFLDSSTIIAVGINDLNGNKGVIMKSTNFGNTWAIDTSITEKLFDVDFSAFNGWACGENGYIIRTMDGGASWGILPSVNTSEDIFSIDFLSPEGWAVGTVDSMAVILYTSDIGNSWIRQNSMVTEPLFSVFFTNNFWGWAVGANGTVLSTTDGGNNWNPQISGTSNDLFDVNFLNNNTGWAVGGGGTVLKTTNGGANWTPENSGTTADIHSIIMRNDTLGWLCGDSGVIRVYGYNPPSQVAEFGNKDKKITIYPNPARSELYIKGNFDVPATFEMYDITGRIVLSQSIPSNQPINISQLSKGLYVYQIKTPDVSVRGKFIKQ